MVDYDGQVAYTYDDLDRVATRAATTFGYAGPALDPVTDGTFTYSRSPAGRILALTDAATSLLAGLNRHGDLAYTHTPAAALVDTQVYDPFGDPAAATGTTNPSVGYQGDYTDPLTSDIWMGARWYSPTWAAFTARDTVFGTLQTPVTLNRYTYAGANPLAYWDPDGRSRRPLVDGVCSNGVRCYAAHEAVLRGAAVIADHIARDNFDDVIVEARRHDSFSREGGLQSAGDKGNRLEGWANQQQGGFARLTPRELFVLATNLDDDILDYAYEYQGLFIESDFDFSDFLIGGLNELTVGSANGLIGLAELGARHNPIARIDAKLPRIPDIPCRHQRSCELGALNGMVGETIVGGLALTRGTSLADDIATTVARRTTRVDDIAPHLDDATRLTQPATGGLPEALTAGRNAESGVHVLPRSSEWQAGVCGHHQQPGEACCGAWRPIRASADHRTSGVDEGSGSGRRGVAHRSCRWCRPERVACSKTSGTASVRSTFGTRMPSIGARPGFVMPVSDVAGTSTNLRVLQPSRRKPAVGDVFAMQLPDGRYVFGRVIKTDAQSGFGPPNAVLIYVYRERYETKTPPEPSELSPDRLLISPLMVNRLPWSKGYFETVASWPLSSGDVLDQHCFRDWTGKYFDDQGNELPGPIEPVGDYGLHSYRSVDDQVSDALGLERAPD